MKTSENRVLTGSQIVMEVLVEQGVDVVFGYPGGAVLNIYDALYDYTDKITHIMPADEVGAGFAADGYARASGKVGVVIATSGPGATNLITPLATAYMDSVPLVAITGNVPTSLIGKDSFQEVYITGISMPVTKHNFMVNDIKDLAKILRKAFKIANSGRKGPVLVDIPKDISAASIEFSPEKEEQKTPKLSDEAKEAVKEALELLKEAKKPLFYIGGGARDNGALIDELMRLCQIPCVHTSMAAGIVSCFEPLNVGLLGMHGSFSANTLMNEADLIVALGARFSDRVALKPSVFAREAKKIHIDIDRSEFHKNVSTDCVIRGDLALVLKDLLELVKQENFKGGYAKWLGHIDELRQEEAKQGDFGFFGGKKEFEFNANEPLTPKALLKLLASKAGEDAIYTTDVGQHQMWALQYLPHQKDRHFLTSGGLGTMGFGYGAALGAALAKPKDRVFHISGDGSFLMNLNEITTAVEYNLPIISIVLNNFALGMVRQWQNVFYRQRFSSTDIQKQFDYAMVAKGFGGLGFSCKSLGEFEKALDEALKSTKPVWIECIIGKDDKVLPMIPSGGSVEDIIIK